MNENLHRLAYNASQRAYSPYSGIRVGAAVIDEGGKIYTGCNIENASYSLTLCAERVAISAAIANGAQNISALAVALHEEGEQVERFTPCGACLQFLAEFASADTHVTINGERAFKFSDLFSQPFAVT